MRRRAVLCLMRRSLLQSLSLVITVPPIFLVFDVDAFQLAFSFSLALDRVWGLARGLAQAG